MFARTPLPARSIVFSAWVAAGVSIVLVLPVERASAQTAPVSGWPDLPQVIVEASSLSDDQALQADGTALQGYLAKRLSGIGPLPASNLLNTPFSFVVIPSALIENTLTSTPTGLIRFDPFVDSFTSSRSDYGSGFMIRGFAQVLQLIDGFPSQINFQSPELYERAETISGASGFLYGQNVPGGAINMVTKRPTAEAMADVTAGDLGGRQLFAATDLGGPISTNGAIGYRLNALVEGGDTQIDNQSVHRGFVDLAVDVRPTPSQLLQFNAGYEHYHVASVQPSWVLMSESLPATPDASLNWSQPFSGVNERVYQADVRYKWAIADAIAVRVGAKYANAYRDGGNVINMLNPDGTYTANFLYLDGYRQGENAVYSYLDARFKTASIEHQITLGFSGNIHRIWVTPAWWASGFAPVANGSIFQSPVYGTAPDAAAMGIAGFGTNRVPRQSGKTENIVFADSITATSWLSFLVGINHSRITDETDDPIAGGLSGPQYDRSANTPTASIIARLARDTTGYVTYTEALEEGGIAPTNATNANQQMAPFTSREVEVGIKRGTPSLMYTLALFDISKAYAYLDDTNTYVEKGRQINTGVELGIFGKPMEELTVFGGFTHLVPRVTDDPSLAGLTPTDVAKNIGKIYLDFQSPILRRLSVSTGAQWRGPAYWTADNVVRYAGHVTFDAGARYELPVLGAKTVMRLQVTNLANRSYWATSLWEGEPRAVSFAVQVHLR